MDHFVRMLSHLLDRVGGPFSFRFVLQPAVAVFFAIRDGMKDSREGRPRYLRTIVDVPEQRGLLLREGARAVGRVLLLGVVMDVAYQLIELRWIYPMELLLIVPLLAFVPYVLLRGVVNRACTARRSPR